MSVIELSWTAKNLCNLQKYGFSARPLLNKPGVGGEGLEGGLQTVMFLCVVQAFVRYIIDEEYNY